MYATYEDYTNTYGGSTISSEDWPRLEVRAAAYIDEITYERLKDGRPIPQEVVLAVCAVADVLTAEDAAARAALSSAGVKSFNNDGYSETLATPAEVRGQYANEKRKAAAVFLPLSHPLRYAGVDA